MEHIIRLDSASDSRLSPYSNLRWKSKSLIRHHEFVVEGRLCVQRLLASQLQVNSVLVQEGREIEATTWIRDRQLPIYVLPAEEIRQLVGFDFHRGFLASALRPSLLELSKLDWSQMIHPLALAVFGVAETENLGSMLRTATALGIRDILMDSRSADPYARRTVRVSMGNVFKQRFYRLDDPVEQLKEMANQTQLRTVVTTLGAGASLLQDWQADHRPVVLVMGNESTGVDSAIEAIANERITIPMEFGTDSLNVSVATGICLYSLVHAFRSLTTG